MIVSEHKSGDGYASGSTVRYVGVTLRVSGEDGCDGAAIVEVNRKLATVANVEDVAGGARITFVRPMSMDEIDRWFEDVANKVRLVSGLGRIESRVRRLVARG